jgi:hypothetical protein
MDDYFAIVPASVRHDKTLSPLDRNVYIEIAARCNGKKYCWPSNKTIGDMLSVHKRTISASISKLVKAGHLKYGTKEHVRYLYTPTSTDVPPTSTDVPPTSTDVPPLRPQTYQRIIEDKKNKYSAVFDEFWKAYPLRNGEKSGAKAAAMREYTKALKHKTAEEIMAALVEYKRSDRVGRGFVLNASNWLKDGHYDNSGKEIADKLCKRCQSSIINGVCVNCHARDE